MGPIFIELTFTTEKTFIINVESIDMLKERTDENGFAFTELMIHPEVKMLPIKETPDEIMEKIRTAKRNEVENICYKMKALGCFR
jgi:hypothetical protein